jgi:hypothetical protein
MSLPSRSGFRSALTLGSALPPQGSGTPFLSLSAHSQTRIQAQSCSTRLEQSDSVFRSAVRCYITFRIVMMLPNVPPEIWADIFEWVQALGVAEDVKLLLLVCKAWKVRVVPRACFRVPLN